MNIISYIDKYGDLTFEESKFNEIDNVIFSTIIYIDLKKYVSSSSKNKKTIKQVYEEYYKDHPIKEKNIIAIKNALKILNYIKDAKRYKNLLLYNYSYIGDNTEQFSAITIEINSKLIYVSFEGTDDLISGWKEDFMMGYKFPILSQKRAINYVNKHFTFSNKKIILGGHSKGGNLALVSGMYSNFIVKRKIINIYNNDGPGLIKKQFESRHYTSIKNKLIHIIPNYSIFGLLLRHDKDYIVIRSTKKSIMAHDFLTWVTEKDQFQRSQLSSFSTIIETGSLNWLDKYNYYQREKFVTSLFQIFDELNIVTVTDIYNNKKLLFEIIIKSKDLDKETKDMLKDFIHVIFKHFKDAKIEELQTIFSNKK